MSCSDSPSGNAFLVDSLITGRAENCGGHYTGSAAVCVPHSNAAAAAAEVPYGLHNYGYFAGNPKRADAGPPNPGAYLSGMEMWMDAQRSCRVDQERSVAPRVTPCSFPQNIKEESTYCLYEQSKCPKASGAEDLTYSRLAPAGSVNDGGGGGTVPMPCYFRLSQTHAQPHKLYNADGPQPPYSHLGPHSGPHSGPPARFHSPATSTQAPSAPQEGSGDREEPVSAGNLDRQPHAAAGSEDPRQSTDAEDSSAEETDEQDKRRPEKGTKGRVDVYSDGFPARLFSTC